MSFSTVKSASVSALQTHITYGPDRQMSLLVQAQRLLCLATMASVPVYPGACSHSQARRRSRAGVPPASVAVPDAV